MLWTASFWKGAAERALKTWMQTFVAVVTLVAGSAAIPAVGLEGVSWLTVLSVSSLAALLSVATSIGNADFTAGADPRRGVDG